MNENKKFFIIGNGFDLANNLPTAFDPDFKSETNDYYGFWEYYQTREYTIWSRFENLLAHPDFNNLESILEHYQPDYTSDRESDRDGIIFAAEDMGNLKDPLNRFSVNAEKKLDTIVPNEFFVDLFGKNDIFLSFNYTHTLEKIYKIDSDNVLHIHGEVGKNNLVLGYPDGEFEPEIFIDDPRKKGRGPYVEVDINTYIKNIDDFYIKSAYEILLNKTKSYSKNYNIDLLEKFLVKFDENFDEIIVYGHSCGIDIPYFEFINNKFKNIMWKFYFKGEEQKENIENLIEDLSIEKYEIIDVDK